MPFRLGFGCPRALVYRVILGLLPKTLQLPIISCNVFAYYRVATAGVWFLFCTTVIRVTPTGINDKKLLLSACIIKLTAIK